MQPDVYFTDSTPQTITLGPQTPTPVVRGNTATYSITVAFGGNNDPCQVNLTAAGLPSGASATISPNPVSDTAPTSTLTITTAANMTPNPAPGYSFMVTVTTS